MSTDKDGFFRSYASRSKTGLGAKYLEYFVAKKADIICKVGGNPTRCLEIGPGGGEFAHQCIERGMQYEGVERSATLQAELAEQGLNVQLGSVPPIPAESNQYDLVCLLAVLEHMATFEQGIHLLKECHRVLGPGGIVAVEVPDYIRAGIDFYEWDYTHSFILTDHRLRQILLDSEFEPIKVVHFSGGLSSRVLRLPVDLVGFLVHSRFVYWLATSLGLQNLLFRFHKTFEPSILAIARKK